MKKRSAFTLIELLVVIAIIALLLSVIIPALRKAKTQSKMVVCRSNMRGVQTGLLLYLEANDQKMFPYSGWLWIKKLEAHVGDLDEIRYCPEIVAGVDAALQAAQTANANRWGTSRQPWVWRQTDPVTGQMLYEAGGLGFNGWLYGNVNTWVPAGMENYPYKTMSEVTSPSKTPVFADENWVDSWPRNTNQLHPNLLSDPQTYYNTGDTTGGTSDYAMGRFLVNRHFNLRINISFIDGHVEMIDMKDLWTLAWHRGAKPNFSITLPKAKN
ncbi:MAG TPA: type II secretion system protein [Anaerohalosphaeraceae bacterium]|nr:type II secretion system protein [Phycisphaerae bacterium]HOK95638.1 type II secretion system protein [Anaerohalosphaeraceae bacterium]HOL32083.1 type II secretion system protein [Anaerohalosphaeraceae bacterium]HOM75519.1 type II secretion system protein [Anaerohalosphaeraceae bacterium]HPC64906.1 type II secretion system protein [Anaerohalosphaeraceae bacterium]